MGETIDFPGTVKADNDADKLRAEQCLSELDEILKRHNCVMLPYHSIVGAEVTFGILVKARPYVPATSMN